MAKGDRLPRLLKLINMIQSHPGLSAAELGRECGVGSRQIFRDLRELEYGGVPIYHEDGYRMAGTFLIQDISFSLDEALALLYGLKLVERQQGLFPVKRLKEHLLSLLPQSLRLGIEDLGPMLDVGDGPAVDYSDKSELFRTLNQAIRRSRRVELDYYSFNRDERNQRIVDPYQLIYKDGFWYLVGYCHWREAQRLFRLDRIRHILSSKERFEPPQVVNVATAAAGTTWGMELGPEYPFQVRFWGDSARFVRETQFHPSQEVREEADGVVLFTAQACGLRPVARWVLSFGGEAEVLTPAELREMVAGALRAGAARYR
jgi:predicted DNA-binding transcriptional regulator YafY